MRRKTAPETPDVIQAKICKGHGQGFGKNYLPWHQVGDFRSRGEQTIIRGLKIKRDHHYFSIGEYRQHLVAEYSPKIIDIREQYPLLPLEESLDIADQCGIRHPNIHGHPKVITLDFLFTLQSGATHRLVARSIKRSEDLVKPRVIQKLELERRILLNCAEY